MVDCNESSAVPSVTNLVRGRFFEKKLEQNLF